MKLVDHLSLLAGINKQDISALAQAITLVESKNLEHRKEAALLLKKLSPLKTKKAKIIGISGTPGVGKSTFIESFGKSLTAKNKRVAVLAIDPSSQVTGGSILGDKTRMNELAIDPLSFIRPSPSGKTLGGVALKTREAIRLCEEFGFDYIIVETVGVGQSEVAVSKIVDFFLLLLQPGAGDDLQAIKRGILELADLVCINKADGQLLEAAKRAKNEYENALKILRGSDHLQIVLCSALKKEGLTQIESFIEDFYDNKKELISKRAKEQMNSWVDELIEEELLVKYLYSDNSKHIINKMKERIKNNEIDITSAIEKVIQEITKI